MYWQCRSATLDKLPVSTSWLSCFPHTDRIFCLSLSQILQGKWGHSSLFSRAIFSSVLVGSQARGMSCHFDTILPTSIRMWVVPHRLSDFWQQLHFGHTTSAQLFRVSVSWSFEFSFQNEFVKKKSVTDSDVFKSANANHFWLKTVTGHILQKFHDWEYGTGKSLPFSDRTTDRAPAQQNSFTSIVGKTTSSTKQWEMIVKNQTEANL